jgi:hypothetical protein
MSTALAERSRAAKPASSANGCRGALSSLMAPRRFPPARPNRFTLGLDRNVGDHDRLPRRIAASLFGAEGHVPKNGEIIETRLVQLPEQLNRAQVGEPYPRTAR